MFAGNSMQYSFAKQKMYKHINGKPFDFGEPSKRDHQISVQADAGASVVHRPPRFRPRRFASQN